MGTLLTLEEGKFLTAFARQTIEEYIQNQRIMELPTPSSKTLQEPRSVFVTIKKGDPNNRSNWILRGCIGRLQPDPHTKSDPTPLLKATQQAALSSALEDPRFPPVRAEELDSVLIEVSVLTMPDEVTVQDRTKITDQITVGKDGLIIDGGGWRRGLLLPQVAPEQRWNATEFLEGCCQKAGLPPDSYLNPEIKVLKFQAQIFAESQPKGEIIERKF